MNSAMRMDPSELRMLFIHSLIILDDERALREVRQLLIDAIDVLEQTHHEERLLAALKAMDGTESLPLGGSAE